MSTKTAQTAQTARRVANQRRVRAEAHKADATTATFLATASVATTTARRSETRFAATAVAHPRRTRVA